MAVKQNMLVTVSGFSGSGKTTLAAALVAQLENAVLVDSDRTRKELYGVPVTQKLPQEAYTPDFTARLIAESDRRILEYLSQGKTVVQSVFLDTPAARQRQENLARQAGVPFTGIWLKTGFATLLARVEKRKNDASDAGRDIVEMQSKIDVGKIDWPMIDASLTQGEMLQQALKLIPEN